jgi:HSP20 family molecular chaperone IbpA
MSDMSVQHSQSQSLRDVNEEFESRKQDLKADHESKIRTIQKAYLKHEQEVRDSGDAAINHIRKDSQQRVEVEAGYIKENADQVLARVDGEAKQKIKSSQEQGINTSEGLKRQYSKDINSTQRKGESELQATREKYDQELRTDENFYRGQLDDEKKQFSTDQNKLQTQYEQKRKETTELQRKNIQELTKKYNEQFVRNEGQNKESFQIQKEQFLKEIYRQQQDLQTKATEFDNKASDPFYQSRNIQSDFYENDGSYVIRAKIPLPEKNNFSIHVKDDKAILESYRKSEAKTADGPEKSTTNSYQTYRQEFKLGYPVHANMIEKQLDDDGNLTVTIPKKDLRAKV